MTVWNPPVPPGDRVEDHYCGECRQPWEWCGCECGASRFADCPLPLGHAGICEERE